jgi:hypothetical protein
MKHGAERKQVRAGIDRLAFDLLGRHVLDRTENHPRRGQLRRKHDARRAFSDRGTLGLG